jgi:hypothetical protein
MDFIIMGIYKISEMLVTGVHNLKRTVEIRNYKPIPYLLTAHKSNEGLIGVRK